MNRCGAILFGWCVTLGAHAACTVSGTPVAFGAYASPGGGVVDSSGTVTVTCDAVSVLGQGLLCLASPAVSLGTGGAGSYAPRRLSSGPHTLAYNLYRDAARTMVWGDGSGGTVTAGGLTLTLLSGSCGQTLTVYGRLPAAQNVAAGAYTDTIIVTVEF